MNRIYFVLFLFLLSNCSFTKHIIRTNGNVTCDFKELSHGIYISTVDSIDSSKYSQIGHHSFVKDVDLLFVTDTINGEIGTHFGIEYMVKTPFDTSLNIKKVWIFPDKMIGENGKKYYQLKRDLTIDTNASLFTSYGFDNDFEIIPGKWILRLYCNSKLLYEKIFIIRKSAHLMTSLLLSKRYII